MSSKYSIILPVRNGGAYVKQCVNSIFSQTLQDFNLIVLDNNSNDGTLQWLQSLNDERIIIYPSAESLSMVQNWGRIKSVPKNEFITLIGHDDILLPHYLEEMELLIAKHPAARLYQAHYEFINSEGDFTGYCKPMDEVQYGHEFLACHMAQTMDSMGTGYMMRSADYDMLGGISDAYPNLLFADYQLWIELSLLNYKATTSRTCFNYRLHNSISKVTNGEDYQQAFEKYIYFISSLIKVNPLIKAVCDKYGHQMLLYYCESLSHRILKTPSNLRKITVEAFIEKCKMFAKMIIPDQAFEPSKRFRIAIAAQLDSNAATRSAFLLAKKLQSLIK